MSTMLSTNCPYKGLQPYTEEDRKYFFGRERDKEVVASNLYVTPLTVLYGGSGVGKSSVLQAGVIPKLRAKARTVIVYFNEWQSDAFDGALKQRVLAAVCEAKGLAPEAALGKVSAALVEAQHEEDLPEEGLLAEESGAGSRRGRPQPVAAPAASRPVEDFKLDDLLLGCARGLHVRMLLIFDQFEEYFLYHMPGTSAEGFDAEFARAVNQNDDGVNFMISMREEELSKLDRFRVRIPNLLTNLLRLEKLDREAAAEAITRPLDVYNEEHPEAQKSIEPALVEAILNQVAPENLGDGAAGQQPAAGQSNGHGDVRIETPFLQVVLTRLWEEERRQDSAALRLKTLDDLGGAKNIARTHLDEVMSKLEEGERDTAASVLRFLVTPAGAKIAQQPTALAAWAELDAGAVRNVLTHLSSRQEMCILRKVTVPGQEERYELFHDVLGPAILNWQSRYTQQRRLAQQKAQAEERIRKERRRVRRLAFAMAGLVVMLVAMGGLTAYALSKKREADRQRAEVEEQRSEVETQRNRALEQEQIAKNAVIAVGQERDRANEEKTRAEEQKTEAEEQKTEAEKQKKLADELKVEADRQAKLANDRAAEAQLNRDKLEAEALKGDALSNLMEGQPKQAADKFKELDTAYATLQNPAGRAYANSKLADIHKSESYIDFLLWDMVGGGTGQGDDLAGDDEAAQNEFIRMYAQMVTMAAQNKDQTTMLKEGASRAESAAGFYRQALSFNQQAGAAADHHRQAGEILNKLGDVEVGLLAFKLDLISGDKAAQKVLEDDAWEALGKALRTYESARARYGQAGLPLEEAKLYKKMAAILTDLVGDTAKQPAPDGEPKQVGPKQQRVAAAEQKAIESYSNAAEAYRRARQPLQAASMHKSIGDLHRARQEGNPERSKAAAAQYELARKIYQERRDAQREALITHALADLYRDSDADHARALSYYKQSHAAYIRARAGTSESQGFSETGTLQEIAKIANESEAGKAALRQYVDEELPAAGIDAVSLARAAATFGDYYRSNGEAEEALWHFARERETWRKAGRLQEEADTLLKIGKFQDESGAVADSLRTFGEARKVYAASDAAPKTSNETYIRDLSDNLSEMAGIYAKHDLKEALATYGEAVAWHFAQPQRRGRVSLVFRRVGTTLLGLKTAEAEQGFVQLYESALERLGAANDFSAQGAALFEIANVYLSSKEPHEEGAREAVKLHERALAARLRAGDITAAVGTFRNIGEAKIKAGESEQAVVAYLEAAAAEATAANDRGKRGSALEALGHFYRAKDLPKTLEFFQQARVIYGEAKLTDAEVSVLRSLAYIYYEKNNREQGDKLYKEADALAAKVAAATPR